jgi:hypothetical protein
MARPRVARAAPDPAWIADGVISRQLVARLAA